MHKSRGAFHLGADQELNCMAVLPGLLTQAAVWPEGRTWAIFQSFSSKGRGQGRCIGLRKDPQGAGDEGREAELLPLTIQWWQP